MPRPKRTKVTPSAPTVVTAASMRFNSAVRDSASPGSSGRATTNSDDSEGIVKTIRKTAKLKDGDVQMSGALALEDVKGSTRRKPPSGRQRAALSRIAREADHAQAIEALKKRRDEAIAKDIAEQASGQVVVPSSFIAAQEVATQPKAIEEALEVETRTVERIRPVPASNIKAQVNPRVELSILALTNFKRRPRQPSILQIARQGTTASGSDSESVEMLDGMLDGVLDGMLDDFQPDDESTPVHVSRLQPRTEAVPSHPSVETPSMLQLSSSGSRKRKITPPEIQVPRSQSPSIHVSSSPPNPLRAPDEENSDVIPTATSTLSDTDLSEPDLPSQRPRRTPAPDMWSDTMAPPQSSSPIQSPAKDQSTRSLHNIELTPKPKSTLKRKQTSRNVDAEQFTKSQTTRQQKEPLKPISTATLQNLLPRRRNRQRDDFDVPSSSEHERDTLALAEDEDELSFAAPKSRRKAAGLRPRQRTAKVTKTPAAMRKTTARGKSRGPGLQKKKDTDSSGPVRTYSRRMSDKENEGAQEERDSGSMDGILPEDLSDADTSDHRVQVGRKGHTAAAPQVKATKELKTLAQKFVEVDAWEMEFEEVTASSSSPRDGR